MNLLLGTTSQNSHKQEEKNTPSYGWCRWCTPLQVICILQLLSQWIVCVPPPPFISSWRSLASGYSVFTKFLGKTKKTHLLFQSIGKCWIFGEKTHTTLCLKKGMKWMNDLRAHKIWASRTLNNNKQQQQQQEACCFSIVLPWNKEDICSTLSAWKARISWNFLHPQDDLHCWLHMIPKP